MIAGAFRQKADLGSLLVTMTLTQISAIALYQLILMARAGEFDIKKCFGFLAAGVAAYLLCR
jgi:hypothetical protein